MEGSYGVYFGKRLAGKVNVIRQGLYYRFVCRCQISGDVICRLYMNCGNQTENLGVVVPTDDGFGLETRLPAKKVTGNLPTFRLIPRYECTGSVFVPITPEEPFAYIQRLKSAFLVKKEGQMGIIVNT